MRAFLPPGFHQFTSIADYQEGLIDRLFPEGNSVRMTPEAARKLTEDAISYARGSGFRRAPITKRRALLFPEDERVICKIETGPGLYSDIALRVAFAMPFVL